MKITGFFALSVATLASVMVTSGSASLAQSVIPEEAQALLQAAHQLTASGNDIETVTAAYEKALQASDSVDDPAVSLAAIKALVDRNYAACRDELAIHWNREGIERLQQLAYMEDTYIWWVHSLTHLYHGSGQVEAAVAAYADGLSFLASVEQSALATPNLWVDQLKLLQLKLGLEDISNVNNRESELATENSFDITQTAAALDEAHAELLNASYILAFLDAAKPHLAELDTAENSPGVLSDALQRSQQYDYKLGEIEIYLLLSEAALQNHNYGQAFRYVDRASGMLNQLEFGGIYYAETAFLLGRSFEGQGNDETAQRAYMAALERYRNGPMEWVVRNDTVLKIAEALVELYNRLGQSDLAAEVRDNMANEYYSQTHKEWQTSIQGLSQDISMPLIDVFDKPHSHLLSGRMCPSS